MSKTLPRTSARRTSCISSAAIRGMRTACVLMFGLQIENSVAVDVQVGRVERTTARGNDPPLQARKQGQLIREKSLWLRTKVTITTSNFPAKQDVFSSWPLTDVMNHH